MTSAFEKTASGMFCCCFFKREHVAVFVMTVVAIICTGLGLDLVKKTYSLCYFAKWMMFSLETVAKLHCPHLTSNYDEVRRITETISPKSPTGLLLVAAV